MSYSDKNSYLNLKNETADSSIKVSVHIITYNQIKFISQAIESVLKQQVNFKYEIIIGDDFSTDGTREILQDYQSKYPDIIKLLLHPHNLGPKKVAGKNNFLSVLNACTGKYIALLDGDDYWTDKEKLQKQFDFLEKNNEYSICWTKYEVLTDNNNFNKAIEPDWLLLMKDREIFNVDAHNVFNPYATLSLTAMFKKAAFNHQLYKKMKHAKDNTLYCMCLSKGKGAILNFFGGVYRMHDSGVFSGVVAYRQKYSNFLNLNEIIHVLPHCNTVNLKTARNIQLLEAFNICLAAQRFADLPKLFKLYYKIKLYCKPADSSATLKVLLKQIALLIKKINKKPANLARLESNA